MATEYSGIDLAVEFGAIDISGTARTVEVSETAPAPETIDTTHKGDSERQSIEGFPGAPETNVTLTVLDHDAGTGVALGTQTFNSKDTLKIYPDGKTHGYKLLTLNNARLHERTTTVPYDGVVEISATWNAKNSLTIGTYSSA